MEIYAADGCTAAFMDDASDICIKVRADRKVLAAVLKLTYALA